MTDRRRVNQRRYCVDSGSGAGWEVPAERLDELPAPSFLPRLSKLRGIRPAVPGPTIPTPAGSSGDGSVPAHIEMDALKTILERHVTGADGICFCGERAGEFTGRCSIGRRAAKRLTELGFLGHEVPAPPGRSAARDDSDSDGVGDQASPPGALPDD